MEQIIFALDIGTTKICAIVGEARQGQLRIIGIGIEPSKGIKKGMIVNPSEASVAIARAVEKAEQTSGYDLSRAFVSMAGEHIDSTNSSGTAPIGRNEGGVTANDIGRALEMAQAISIPQNRQIVHLIPRRYKIDDNDEVKNPLGMFGYRLEVEAHIVTAAAPALQNLSLCTDNVGITTEEFVLNALASAEAVLEPSEREMGVLLADIGGGTTDLALYTEGMAWHTAVLPIGGKPLIAWSAGAMLLADNIVVFHDFPPQGPGQVELLDSGLGLLRNWIVLPHARSRLQLDDRRHVANLAARFAPARCVTLNEGSELRLLDGAINYARNVRRLGRSGRLALLKTV